MRQPMIVAHRGASRLAKENTVASFAKAIEIGADMIEFDVRRTKDRVMVVHHDPTVQGRSINQLTHREANDLLAPKGVVIPTVEEVLALTRGKIKLDVELKESGYEKEIIRLIRIYFQSADFVATSFLDQTVATVKQCFPTVRTGLLLGYNPAILPFLFNRKDFFPENRVRQCGADFLAPHYSLLKYGFTERAAKEQKAIFVWTVDEPVLLTKLMTNPNIQAIITNQPDLAISLYNKLPTQPSTKEI